MSPRACISRDMLIFFTIPVNRSIFVSSSCLSSARRLQCCCFPCGARHEDEATIVEDNCCRCNYAALSRMMLDLGEIEVVYATFHVDVGETPFFVALDYTKRKVCLSPPGLSRSCIIH